MLGSADAMLEYLARAGWTNWDARTEGTEIWGMLFGHMSALETYQASDLNWTVVTPPFNILGQVCRARHACRQAQTI